MNATEYSERILGYERCLVSWCLDGKEADVISSGITPEMFHHADLGKIYKAILKSSIEGNECDLLGIQKHIADQKLLILAVECTENTSRTINIKSYARTVKEAANLRRNIKYINEIFNEAVASDPLEPYPLLERLSRIETKNDPAGGLDQFHGSLMSDMLSHIEKGMEFGTLPAISTGMKKLDSVLKGGIYPGHVITIAGRPGGGKTTLAVSIASTMSKNGHHPLYVTVEMNSMEFAMKVTSKETGISQDKIIASELSPDELDRVSAAAAEQFKRKVSVYSRSGANWERVMMMIRNAVKYHGVDIVFIDYIQQYRMTKRLTQREELDIMAQQTKAIAQDLSVPIVLLSQLNREIEKRGSGADPKMSDIKESGTIEQASDAVLILIDDKDACNERGFRHEGPWLVMVKNRWGEKARWPVYAKFNTNHFYEE